MFVFYLWVHLCVILLHLLSLACNSNDDAVASYLFQRYFVLFLFLETLHKCH